ncbi:hypothetical protein DQ384_26085 [Sphaerisporangium album]|uniref:Uncharacterized protein n=1 Tax=Sphaerisporangium album TaxID=509200 RepID=A0A367FBE8_9ACTN|nr:hypothetical protein [Sphaerisporangium album]RCG27192.1 hypothetical protein DQ384_26085 [Sphaerisporangium album]
MSEIPRHCPYKAGDRVQMHGYSGEHVHRGGHLNDHAVTGFRGVVEGYIGATILTGTTDDGRPWAEYWGSLDPDGTPCSSAALCSCCPHPGRRMVNGRVHSGRCRPAEASADRARAAARAHAEWWRTGVRPSGPQIPRYDQGALFPTEDIGTAGAAR